MSGFLVIGLILSSMTHAIISDSLYNPVCDDVYSKNLKNEIPKWFVFLLTEILIQEIPDEI